VLRSFELDPTAPVGSSEPMVDVLASKYGVGHDEAVAMMARTEDLAAAEGLEMHMDKTLHSNTVDAHRLLHLAHEEGRQDELKEALLAAYFLHARNVADHDVLAGVAAEVGLDEVRVKEVLTSSEYADAVEADVRQAVAYGATGVPFFVVDQKYGVAGAQPADVLGQVLERAWTESRPALDVVGGEDACGPDGCAI